MSPPGWRKRSSTFAARASSDACVCVVRTLPSAPTTFVVGCTRYLPSTLKPMALGPYPACPQGQLPQHLHAAECGVHDSGAARQWSQDVKTATLCAFTNCHLFQPLQGCVRWAELAARPLYRLQDPISQLEAPLHTRTCFTVKPDQTTGREVVFLPATGQATESEAWSETFNTLWVMKTKVENEQPREDQKQVLPCSG